MSDALLQRMSRSLERDPRVTAAWLTGSRGRGENDAFSDIDIWVAIGDASIEYVVGDPLSFVHQHISTLMHVIAPEIAPPGGAFVGSWAAIGDRYEQVDWYLVPATGATRSSRSLPLFGCVPIVDGEPESLSEDDARVRAEASLKLALQMTANMVKHARRGEYWRSANDAMHANTCLVNADWLTQCRQVPAFDSSRRSWLPERIPMNMKESRELAHELINGVEHVAGAARVDMTAAVEALRVKINR